MLTGYKYKIGKKYKLVVFLDDDNDLRSQKIVERFAQSARILYVTSDNVMIKKLNNPDIQVYSFDTFFNRLHKLAYKYSTLRLSEEIDKLCLKYSIKYSQVLIFTNTLNYGNVLLSFNGPRIHFDINKKDYGAQPIAETILKKNLYKKINTITSKKMAIVRDFQKFFQATYKIADGIDVGIFEQKNEQQQSNFHKKAGCYCYDPQQLDYELIKGCAQAHKDVQFTYYSDKPFKEHDVSLENVRFVQTENWNVPLDIVILPFKYDNSTDNLRVFYDNIIYQVPVLTMAYEEFPIHREILYQHDRCQDLIASLNSYKELQTVPRPLTQVLLQSVGWEDRLSQLESVILSH